MVSSQTYLVLFHSLQFLLTFFLLHIVSAPTTKAPTDINATVTTTINATIADTTSSLGSEATIYGDATFYLMAEGGTNMAFWKEKLSTLDVKKNGAKFLVHL